MRAIKYYTDSIPSSNTFVSYPCSNWNTYKAVSELFGTASSFLGVMTLLVDLYATHMFRIMKSFMYKTYTLTSFHLPYSRAAANPAQVPDVQRWVTMLILTAVLPRPAKSFI